MDVIIELIVLIIRALAGDDKAKRAGAPKPVPIMQRVEQETRARIAAAPPRPPGPDPVFRNTGWCLAAVLLAFLLALAAGAVLLVYGLGG